MNRRQFINKSAALLAISSFAGRDAFAATPAEANKGRIGIQLYSVKDELPKDFLGTLKKLSDIGYAKVEPYGFNGKKFFDYTMKELSDIVKDMGMTISGTHASSGILPEDTNDPKWDYWKNVATEMKSGGASWVIQSSFPKAETLGDLKKIADFFNRTGEVCQKAAGIKFAFHNHHDEFVKIENEVILDYIIKNTDPKLVAFQLDLGHVVNGGGDCLHYLRTYPTRIALWHASDFQTANREYVEVGKGNVPYPAMFEIANSTGLTDLTVEQETKGDIIASCKVDFDYLKQFKWTQV